MSRRQHELSSPLSSRRSAAVAQYSILRCALRRRRQERAFLDLRQSVLQRRLPNEKMPRARLRRRLRRARPAARLGSFHRGVLAKRARKVIS